MVKTLKSAIAEGQTIDVDRSVIPDQITTPLRQALPLFRKASSKSSTLTPLDHDGLMIAAILSELDQRILDSITEDEDDLNEDGTNQSSTPHWTPETLAQTVETLSEAPAEKAAETSRSPMHNIASDDLEATLAKMKQDAEELAYPSMPPDDHPSMTPATPPKTESTPSRDYGESSLVKSAPFLVDPVLLASRAEREVTEREAAIANEAAHSVMAMEEALGTSKEDARNVGIATAYAITRAVDYPGQETRPKTPKTDAEEQIVLREASSVMEAWAARTKNN